MKKFSIFNFQFSIQKGFIQHYFFRDLINRFRVVFPWSILSKILKHPNSAGFTFIELILYVALVTIILSALVPFAWDTVQTGVKSAVQQEVNANARYISERIKYEIRNAVGINSVAATSISLATSNSGTNPTIIDLSDGNIRIKQGSDNTVNLNSANVVVNSLAFANYTSSDTKTKHIQFTMTAAASFAVARQEYQDSIVVESSVEVRSN